MTLATVLAALVLYGCGICSGVYAVVVCELVPRITRLVRERNGLRTTLLGQIHALEGANATLRDEVQRLQRKSERLARRTVGAPAPNHQETTHGK